MTAEIQSFRRVLIVADESADWVIAGLRQLDRLALSVDELAVENKETSPVLVCIFWRPDLDQSQRWVPKSERLTSVAFTTDLGHSFDLVLNTRLFLYRKAMRQLFSEGSASARPMTSGDASFRNEDAQKHVPPSEEELWKSYTRRVESLPPSRKGAWEYVTDGNEIDGIETRFLRGSGKSQDGFVSRYLNRPLSRAVTRLLLRFPTTPNAWTWFIFPISIAASLILLHGTYWSFFWGLVLFQVFSVLDGCDGEIARAKFLESESGRRLDDLFDILSNILLGVGLGFGLSRQANLSGHSGWFYAVEGLAAAIVIGVNEFFLAIRKPDGNGENSAESVRLPGQRCSQVQLGNEGLGNEEKSNSLGGALYPRHRELVKRSGMLVFGERFAYWLIQLTKRDVAMLFFVFLAALGYSAWILHLIFFVTAISLALSWRARSTM